MVRYDYKQVNKSEVSKEKTMKVFDTNYKLLDEMYQDEYFPNFLVTK